MNRSQEFESCTYNTRYEKYLKQVSFMMQLDLRSGVE